ncbi:MAG: PfkB family carbohydrate kinase [Spirochaetota bacterium]
MITGLGYSGWDYIGLVPYIPHDDKVRIEKSLEQGGGPAATAIVAAARLGVKTAFIGICGDDDRGDMIVRELKKERVTTAGVIRHRGAMSPAAFCWVEQKTGKRSVAWTLGTVRPLRTGDVDVSLIHRSTILHLDGHHIDAAIHAAKIARKAGVTVSIDAGTMVAGIDSLLPLCDIIIASEAFAERYCGQKDPTRAIGKLLKLKPRICAVTLGSRGVLWCENGVYGRQASFSVPVVDTTGAGDVFHGAFAASIAKKMSTAEGMRFAAATAALKCRALGGRTGIPTDSMVMKYLNTGLKPRAARKKSNA